MVKSYVITGANRGLGFEFVKQLSARGDIVFACARNLEKSTDLQALVDNKNVFAIRLDTLDVESIKAAYNEIDALAPGGIDVLINNAGINGTMKLDFEHVPLHELLDVFQTNVAAVNEVTKVFVNLLRKNQDGKLRKILNMSSRLGSVADMTEIHVLGFSPPYCVSKSALNMLTKITSLTLVKENILVFACHPGWCPTDMGGIGIAPIPVPDSIRGQLQVLDGLTIEDSGRFINFEGKELPW